ncbi:MAG: hypothetical protein N2035_02485 [Chthoniobacterales bacterium]|nr:hypothetical protein [Chthoniobacterales bacterium]
MLQQTRAEAVVPYFLQWLNVFPDWNSLAIAPETKVLSLWQGLGYYNRAKSLHNLAKIIVSNFSNCLPSEKDQLIQLPGIGQYTAAAIRVFAFNLPDVPLDANLLRIFARILNFQQSINPSSAKKILYNYGLASIPNITSPRIWFSALMDLGSLICLPQNPICSACPLSVICQAQTPSRLPVKPKRKQIITILEHRAIYFNKQHIFLQKSDGPRWNGLWILPTLEPTPSDTPVATHRYSITRFHVNMNIYLRPTHNFPPPKFLSPIPYSLLSNIPLPSPHRKSLEICKNFVLSQSLQ